MKHTAGAGRGSQRCLQQFIEENEAEASALIVSASPSLLAFAPTRIEWRSPIGVDRYREYGDDFLKATGFEEHASSLRTFWPSGGPKWDGLAIVESTGRRRGVLLVEAKAHPGEMQSDCKATDATSLSTINRAFATTQSRMGIESRDWTKRFYQLANRMAFLHFMNDVANVPTWLVLMNFVDDHSHLPTDLVSWRLHYGQVFRWAGFSEQSPLLDRVVLVYPTAL